MAVWPMCGVGEYSRGELFSRVSDAGLTNGRVSSVHWSRKPLRFGIPAERGGDRPGRDITHGSLTTDIRRRVMSTGSALFATSGRSTAARNMVCLRFEGFLTDQ